MSDTSEELIRPAVKAAGGVRAVAKACGVSSQAVYKWMDRNGLPRTDYTGETDYAGKIAASCRAADPNSTITRELLLGLPEVKDQESHGPLKRRAGEATA